MPHGTDVPEQKVISRAFLVVFTFQMTYFDPYDVQNPLENCCVQQIVVPTVFEFLLIKRGRGIALT